MLKQAPLARLYVPLIHSLRKSLPTCSNLQILARPRTFDVALDSLDIAGNSHLETLTMVIVAGLISLTASTTGLFFDIPRPW